MRLRLSLALLVLLACTAVTTTRQGQAQPSTAIITLTPWENVLFGRWLAIDNTVRTYSYRYRVPATWTMQTFAAESVMNPMSQGSQTDDRGIGQVGYLAENYGRARATNPSNPDYFSFFPNGSIWDVRTNIGLAFVWYRWVYDQPYVKTPQQAYAVSTMGPSAVLKDGTIRWDAQQRVNRATSFGPLITSFETAKETSRSYTWAQLVANVPDPLTRDLLYINAHSTEGADTYAQLAARYIREVTNTKSPWVVNMFGREALTYLDVGRVAYGTNQSANYRALVNALSAKRSLFTNPDLLSTYNTLLADARSR